MRRYTSIIFIFTLFIFFSCNNNDDKAARELAKRIIPEQENMFLFERTDDTTDVFEIESVGKKIAIRGNNSNSIAVGLNYYLKNYCLTTVSWYADNPVEMPAILPGVEGKVRIPAKTGERFFLNYCTFGYTMPWWQWNDWERFIDWMALNGITMPLAITGQEAVWQKVWQKHGLTDLQIRKYFTGPAHLPWHRMSNIDYWDGPLPQSWIDSQAELQKKIIKRERELDMTPVLPAFAGHVPQELKEIYPNAEITRVSYWGGFADEYRCSFLAPMDSLYPIIQKDFLEEQTKLFGTDHIYGIDPFNEIDSPSWDPETLAKMASRIYSSIADFDKDAKWLQMGWLFYADPAHWTQENIKAYLSAVPKGKLIMLDYYCEFTQIWEQTAKFYGQQYIWCYLGNFGGNTVICGNAKDVSDNLAKTFTHGGDNLYGIGSTLEGFGVNQCMYEFILDKAWDSGMDDKAWVDRLADRHSGAKDQAMREAWQMMFDKIYVEYSKTGMASLTCAHPCLVGNWHWTTKPVQGYTTSDIHEVWGKMLQTTSERDSYKFDIINTGRQFMGDLFMNMRDRYTEAYNRSDAKEMTRISTLMLELLDDIDRLVSCHIEFSLEKWIEDAKLFAATEQEKDYYERNARTLISVWGDSYHLADYASRSWSGMMTSFYRERWKMFFNEVITAVKAGKNFDQKAFDQKCWDFECSWTNPSNTIDYPTAGDPIKTAHEMYNKYTPYLSKF